MTVLEQNIAFLKRHHPGLKGWSHDDPTLSQLIQMADIADTTLENLMLFNLESVHLDWDRIRFVFLDVDGVMTEGGMFYTESGDEFKRFDTKDGMAIKVGMEHGIQFGIISSGVNQSIIQHRADMFGIQHVYVGRDPKLKVAEQWLNALGLAWSEVAYIGDDINDLLLFEKSAIAACPADATVPIKKAADFVLMSMGGHGCIREFMRCFPALTTKL
jgi:YrbI family 3-deoxy-D-manno-octulosonate 8-phosphate phosphatase